ncbi:hypothetical protein HanRHA438_Chr09g0383671 [Helianthus annuus]|nr:hypothetical protein HanRHA438_Chr09g0383671 [Helianthus annuus]
MNCYCWWVEETVKEVGSTAVEWMMGRDEVNQSGYGLEDMRYLGRMGSKRVFHE